MFVILYRFPYMSTLELYMQDLEIEVSDVVHFSVVCFEYTVLMSDAGYFIPSF